MHRIRAVVVMGALLTLMICMTMGASVALANPGGDTTAEAFVSALPLSATGSLDTSTTDVRDFYAITLAKGQTLDASMTGDPGTDFDLFLYPPGTTTVSEGSTLRATWSTGPASVEHFTFMAAEAGTYYIDVRAWTGQGAYALDAKIIDAITFKLGGLTVPKSAKKGKSVKVSAWVTPGYNGIYSPIAFGFFHWEKKKWKLIAVKGGSGRRHPGEGKTVLTASYKFPKKGSWRVAALFLDEAHPKGVLSGPKKITIK